MTKIADSAIFCTKYLKQDFKKILKPGFCRLVPRKMLVAILLVISIHYLYWSYGCVLPVLQFGMKISLNGTHFILLLFFYKIVACVTARIMRIYRYSIRIHFSHNLVYVWNFTFD